MFVRAAEMKLPSEPQTVGATESNAAETKLNRAERLGPMTIGCSLNIGASDEVDGR